MNGILHPSTGALLDSGTVAFYSAGTTTPKNVWTSKDKAGAATSITLDADGTKQIYGDGNYKLVIKDSAGTTRYTWDNIRCQYPNFALVTKTATYTATPDDDVILVDTSGGNVTINLEAAANFTHPITIKNIGGNNVVVDPDGSETIDSVATYTISVQNQSTAFFPDGSNWFKSPDTVLSTTKLADSDNDTLVEVEQSSDEDIIRFKVAGTQELQIKTGGLVLKDGGALRDGDNDTKVYVEKSNDEDKVRMDTGGTERFVLDETGLETVTGDGSTLAGVLLGDGTGGRVLRRILVTIDDGSNADTLKVTVASEFNGDAIAETDNVAKGATVGNFSLTASGKKLTIEASGLTGNCVAVIESTVYGNLSTVVLNMRGLADTNDITLGPTGAADGGTKDMTALVNTGLFQVYVTYLTDA